MNFGMSPTFNTEKKESVNKKNLKEALDSLKLQEASADLIKSLKSMGDNIFELIRIGALAVPFLVSQGASAQDKQTESQIGNELCFQSQNICENIYSNIEVKERVSKLEKLTLETISESNADTLKDNLIDDSGLNLELPSSFLKSAYIKTGSSEMVIELNKKLNTPRNILSGPKDISELKSMQDNINALESLFASRPKFSLKEINKKEKQGPEHIGNMGGEYGDESIQTYKVTKGVGFELDNNKSSPGVPPIGNKEIYSLMKSFEEPGKIVAQSLSRLIGCNINDVKVQTTLAGSIHLNPDSKSVSNIPYNNIHPTYEVTMCKDSGRTEGGKESSVEAYFSIFNNSQGYGAEKIQSIGGRVDRLAVGTLSGAEKELKRSRSYQMASNRIVVTAGYKSVMPIFDSNFNFVIKSGLQYGYTTNINSGKLSPHMHVALVYSNKNSLFNGLEIGAFPATFIKGKSNFSTPVVTFSASINTKF